MTLTLYSVPLSRLTISMVLTSSPTKVSRAGPEAADRGRIIEVTRQGGANGQWMEGAQRSRRSPSLASISVRMEDDEKVTQAAE